MKYPKFLKSLAVAFFALAMTAEDVGAVPAVPWPIKVRQADGTTLTIRLYGDESFNYATTVDGYNLVSDNGSWYYAQCVGSDLVSLGVKAADPIYWTAEAKAVLHKASRGEPVAAKMAAFTRSQSEGIAFGASPRVGMPGAAAPQVKTVADEGGEDNFRSLVILAAFPDLDFSIDNPQHEFDRMLNEKGYSDNGATGSARDYYEHNSNGKFRPHFDVVGPVMLPHDHSYYVDNQEQFISDACDAANDSGVDFTRYVGDNGYIRDVFIYFAGHNAAENGEHSGTIWPARMFFLDESTIIGTWDGVSLRAAAYTSELKGLIGTTKMAGIGTFCHEFGHILGWPDFYDTDYENNGLSFNLDVFSLMASGSYLNDGRTPPALTAIERSMAGWMTLTEISEPGEYEIEPLYDGKGYMINTTNEGEYFVFEYRNGLIDSVWDGFLENGDNSGTGLAVSGRGSGMMVYHVDQSETRVNGIPAWRLWGAYNRVNAYADHEACRIVMASPVKRNGGTLRNMGNIFFPGTSGATSFTATSTPAFAGWDGFTTGFDIVDIRETGSKVTFTLSKVTNGTISDFMATPFQTDVFVTFRSPFSEEYTVTCSGAGKEYTVTTTDTDIAFNGLQPGTEYTVEIFYGDEAEPLESVTVKTDSADTSAVPSLYLQRSNKQDDPIFLAYRNVSSPVKSVKWMVNGTVQRSTIIRLPSKTDYEIEAEITTDSGVLHLVKFINVN